MDIQLSPHFRLSELIRSETAARLGLDNWPRDPRVIENLRVTALNILEPIRNHFGVPFAPNRGYRSPEVNRATGGSKTRQHMTGQAVDVELPGVSNHTLAEWARKNLQFDQIILECYRRGIPNRGWVHLRFAGPTNRHQTLTFIQGQGYLPGFVV